METLIVTALFDIKRENKGDGRSISDYLEWFGKTLQLKCDILVFTEQRFLDFVLEKRKDIEYKTYIIKQDLTEIPFYVKNDKMKEIITSKEYLNKMSDTSRIECYLSEYNVIQYSKFGWLKIATDIYPEYDSYFWMDAGCSRFFGDFDTQDKWPDQSKIDKNKLTIQGNSNFTKMFNDMKISEYIWDNNCMLVGTLFGAGKDIIHKLHDEMYKIFDYFISQNCINNEQFALAIFVKQNPNISNVVIKLDGTHLPLFKILK